MGKPLKSENKRNMFQCRLALEQKKVPASLTWWHFSEVLIFFALWFSANSQTQKLNSDKFNQWRIRRRMWRNMYQYRRSFSHKVTTRRFCPQHPTLTPGAGSKTAVGRSIYIYIYIYIYISWRKAKSTRNCGARLRLAPTTCCLRFFNFCPGT